MTNQELCTQYELIVALIESGNTEKAVEILKNAIQRIDKNTANDSDKSKN